MANAITLAKKYVPVLDKTFKNASKTSVLDVAPSQVKAAANAGEFLIQKLALVGLGTYSKTAGAPAGDVTLTWETHSYDYDRGRKFIVDAVDDLEAMGAFGNVAAEFIRTEVVPEVDAIRLSTLFANAGTTVTADLSTAANWVSALEAADVAMTNAEVPEEGRILFITKSGYNLVKNQANTAATTQVLDEYQVVIVPQSRFYTAITLDAGATSDAGGYTKAAGAGNINFLVVQKSSCFVDAKHNPAKVITPEVNQDLDAYEFHYRLYHDVFPYENRTDGIYAHRTDGAS